MRKRFTYNDLADSSKVFCFLIVLLFDVIVCSCDESKQKDTTCLPDTCVVETIENSEYTPSPPSSYFYPIIQNEPRQMKHREPTPDDAYDEGYCAGEEQGRYDGRHGETYGDGFDDSSDYYDYYETKYQEGYQDGYDNGYYEGQSDYEDEQDIEDNEEEW